MARDENSIVARRVWLNDDPTTHARIVTELAVFTTAGGHREIVSSVDIADCARTCTIDLWAFDAVEAAERVQKLDRMIDELLNLRNQYSLTAWELFKDDDVQTST